MKYSTRITPRRPWVRRVLLAVAVLGLILTIATVAVWRFYSQNLKPLNPNGAAQTVVIESGATPTDIANQLHDQKIIRSAWTFEAYVRQKGAGGYLQAGTYSLSPAQDVPTIVSQLTHGRVTTDLVTVLPGQRLDQIKQSLINAGFAEEDVEAALQPGQYEDNAALVDKPVGNSLEGYLYPESFQRTSETRASDIVEASIAQMQKQLTPDIRAAFAEKGLSVYQGIILASIVEQEVSKQQDRNQAAQVFLKRLDIGMQLGSDVTAFYGSQVAGQGNVLAFDSPYNTRMYTGLPPTPISNVSASSLKAVAYPASTDWLYFVAGDDGNTYFSRTVAEHEALTAEHCKKLCEIGT